MNNLDNQVVFAAAGNGKTYSLCSKARSALNSTNKYVLLVSYTNEGIRSLEREYRKQNYGVLDDRVIFKTWYSFLLSDFIKPYQCELRLKEKIYKQEHMVTLPENYISSIAFYSEETPPKWFNKSHFRYFINQNGDVVPDRASHWRCCATNTQQEKQSLELRRYTLTFSLMNFRTMLVGTWKYSRYYFALQYQ